MVRVTPLGGASEIGGSSMFVELFDARVLVDYGMRPGGGAEGVGRYPDLAPVVDAGPPHAVLLTHAHLDHSGGLPLLNRRWPGVPVFASPPSIRLSRILLEDSFRIMDRDREGEVDFDLQDVEALQRAFVPAPFGDTVPVTRTPETRVTATLFRAGHILGAAMVGLEARHEPTGRVERVLVSGDVSLFDQPTLPGADRGGVEGFRPTVFVCEGTYGDSEHPPLAMEEAGLARRVARVLARGGKVLIPAFAVGRSQNVALILRRAMRDPSFVREALGDDAFRMPRAPIYIDGMCRTVCDQYNLFRDYLSGDLAATAAEDGHAFYDPEGLVRPVKGRRERTEAVNTDEPAVIISSSGMLSGGPSVMYARQLAPRPENAIVLCGYQDEESPGRMLQRLQRARSETESGEVGEVTIGGHAVPVRCEIDTYALSAHSDAPQLTALIEAVDPRHVLLVHGDPVSLAEFRKRLTTLPGGPDVRVSHRHEPLEAETTEVLTRMLPPVREDVDPWEHYVLTGRAGYRGAGLGLASAFVSTSLRYGPRFPVREEDVAREQSRLGRFTRLEADELAAARASMHVGEDVFWSRKRVGADWYHLADGPALGQQPVAELARRARDRFSRDMWGDEHLDEHRERVRERGIGVGDLVLWVSGASGFARLQPAVLTGETGRGFEALAPAAPKPELPANQILARVGPWVWTYTAPSSTDRPTLEPDARLLHRLAGALASFSLEHALEWFSRNQREGSGEVGHADRDTYERQGQVYQALWDLVTHGELSYVAGALASTLFHVHRFESVVQCEVEDLQTLMGGPDRVSPAMVLSALEELEALGLIRVSREGPALQLVWSAQAMRDFTATGGSGAGGAALRALGRSYERLLRRAFLEAMSEVDRMGLKVRSEFAYWLDVPGSRAAALLEDGPVPIGEGSARS